LKSLDILHIVLVPRNYSMPVRPSKPPKPPKAPKPPSERPHTKPIARTQALTLYSKGRSYEYIEAQTGIKRSTVIAIARRAADRGWRQGDPVLKIHVANAPRSGRPTIVNESTAKVIHNTLYTNSITRMYSGAELADYISRNLRKKNLYMKTPSRRIVLRWLKKNKYKNVKHTIKPGLTRA
jgi:hypothetical protein